MNNIDFALGTHTGLVRELNEDSHLALPQLGLWVIADGMGGHQAGEVASGITIREIARSIEQGMPLGEAIEAAHRAIQTAALQGDGAADMGSTVVALKLDGMHYEIAWVGDSRAYLWNGTLHQLTTDHSYVQMLLNAGLITESEIPGHPSRNVITQALGVGGADKVNIKVDLVSGELGESDILLLCSDGLSGEVADDDIAAILAETTDAQTRVDRLIAAALEAGGKDNMTVIAINSVVI
ncbi:MAG: protein phosphatase 2C domain-containing protein [Methylobacter sp.]|uniref:Protein phosphatase 2C domain-containing protein n=1 Tax=Candidatus Methylobacter titanis TaxID=3053457 RepID=A0AA43Q3B2_9GAMM|nr:protein phosphatase 2C domain-containing protein [Candidatus Methylobacter titanis]MDI1293478.1 protein phosphatase 2C domain-containing protein [Candidatus Methylobacter titanis]